MRCAPDAAQQRKIFQKVWYFSNISLALAGNICYNTKALRMEADFRSVATCLAGGMKFPEVKN